MKKLPTKFVFTAAMFLAILTAEPARAQLKLKTSVKMTQVYDDKSTEHVYHFCERNFVAAKSNGRWSVGEVEKWERGSGDYMIYWFNEDYSLNGTEEITLSAKHQFQIISHTDAKQTQSIKRSSRATITDTELAQVRRLYARHKNKIYATNIGLDQLEKRLGIYDSLSLHSPTMVGCLRRKKDIKEIAQLKRIAESFEGR